MRAALFLPLLLAGCVSPSNAEPQVWRLVSIDGQPFDASATLVIDGDSAYGQAPCNRWTGQVETSAPSAWRLRKVAATMMACDDLAEELAFFAALQAMTHQARVGGDLELTDQSGGKMRFVPAGR